MTVAKAEQGIQPDQTPIDRLVESRNAKIEINPEGGYVSSWQVRTPQGDFVNILYQGTAKKRTGIPLLFPYYGDADGMRSHGFGRDSKWKTERDGNKAVMKLTSGEIDETARSEYPQPFEAQVSIGAEDNGSMVYHLRVKNTGDRDLSHFSPGLHPYWAVDHKGKPDIRISGIDGFDAGTIDWEQKPPDTEFSFKERVVELDLPDRVIKIEDITESRRGVETIVVWSQTPEKDDHDFVCVEPVNVTPIKVVPGSEWDMKLRFSTVFK